MDKGFLRYKRVVGTWKFGGGATHPNGLATAASDLSDQLESMGFNGFDVEITSNSSIEDLITNLENGYPTIIYGVNANSDIPHAMVVAGYSPSTDTWSLLDPARNSTKNPFKEMNTQELLEFWTNWGPIFKKRTMITLMPE